MRLYIDLYPTEHFGGFDYPPEEEAEREVSNRCSRCCREEDDVSANIYPYRRGLDTGISSAQFSHLKLTKIPVMQDAQVTSLQLRYFHTARSVRYV